MVRLLVTYMAMTAPPGDAPLAPAEPRAVVAAERLDLAAYRDLYRAIGDAVQWDEHVRLCDGALTSFLADPAVTVHVLRVDGRATGLCEFDGRGGTAVRLKHFGIVPEAYGRHLGPYLLDMALRAAWTRRPKRIWLSTDTNDHPRARATYERAGFRAYDQRWEDFPD